MEDLLWSLTQESRTLQELRQDIKGVWQDEAARELTSRYLDPHENEDQQMLVELKRQKDSLDQSRLNLVSAEGHARQAEENAALVAEGLKSTQEELRSAYANYDTYAQYNAESRSKFPLIQKLINQANSACSA